jgi:hypothetical protein
VGDESAKERSRTNSSEDYIRSILRKAKLTGRKGKDKNQHSTLHNSPSNLCVRNQDLLAHCLSNNGHDEECNNEEGTGQATQVQDWRRGSSPRSGAAYLSHVTRGPVGVQ